MVGYLARSIAGHDNGKVYVIISEDDLCVLLSDGDIRKKANPKKKNKKHIQIIKKVVSINNDEEIKHNIKLYESSIKQNN